MPNDTTPITITLKELAGLLHRSPATILSDLSRRPESLPKWIRTGRGRIWLFETVMDWLRSRQTQIDFEPTARKQGPARKKRGAPTKAERIRRRQAEKV